MAALEIALLGAPTVTQNGKPVSINRNKSMALLAYLALADGPLRRDSLATLLWPDLDQAHARANLRRELAYLRDELSAEWFTADRETLALEVLAEVSVDVVVFRSHLAALQAIDWTEGTTADEQSIARLAEAISVYRGDFLDGFSLRDAPAFDDWQYYTGEELRRKLAWVLDLLLHVQREAGNLATAQELALRRLAIDPLDEAIHAQLIDLYLSAGNRSAAWRQYNRCVTMLERELGVPPSSVLLALGEAIHAAQDALPIIPDPLSPQSLDRSPAEIRTVVALSLSVLPDTDFATRKRFAFTTRHVDAFLAACREHLSAAAGHVIYANSESLLAVFGIPAAHEDDAERCVLSAFSLRNAAEQYEFDVAIGVAAGQAYVRNGGDRNSPAETIMGPVLNLAADVQRAAGRNEVVADRAIYQLTWGVVDYGEAMHITLRGGPVEVRRAHRPRMEGDKARGISGLRTQMVGRARELAMLRRALEQALRGEGQAAFVVGDAGLGKSRLVAELRRSAHTAGNGGSQPAAHWLAGRCRESTEMIGFAPFAEVIRRYFGWEPGASESERLAALSAGLERLRQHGSLAESQAGEIAAVLGDLCDVRFGDVRDDLLRHADPAQVRYRSIVALTALLLAVADTQPLVLVLEDLHWADPASLDLVRSLLAEARKAPILLLCVYRPGQHYDCSQLPVLASRRLPGHVTGVEVRELSNDQMRQLLEGLLRPHRLPFALFERIVDQAQGNPFFAEEIVRSLIDAGQIARNGGVWVMVARLDDLVPGHAAVTPGIDALVQSRLDRLDPAQRSLLQAAAVLGTSFELRVLAHLQATPLPAAAMRDLEQRGFVLCERLLPNPEYTFKHVLLHEAVYNTLPAPHRASLHEQAAQAIERIYADDVDAHFEQLAQHYLNTDNHAATVRYLMRAGAKARRSFLNEQACRYFEQALERCALLDPAQTHGEWQLTRADLWLQLGRVLLSSGKFSEGEVAFREALVIGEANGWDVQAIVDAVYWLGEALFWQGKLEELGHEAAKTLARLDDESATIEHVLMLGHQAAAACSLGKQDVAAPIVERIQDIILDLPFQEVLSPAYDHVIDHQMIDHKDPEMTQFWIDALRDRARSKYDLNSEAKAIFAEATLKFSCGDMVESKRAAEQAYAIVLGTGEKTLRFFCVVLLAELALASGDMQEAVRVARAGLDLIAEVERGAPFLVTQLAVILLGAGEIDQAIDVLQEASLEDDLPANLRQHTLLWLAQARLASGHCDAAAEICRNGLALGRPEFVQFSTIPLFRSMLAEYLATLDAAMNDASLFRVFCDELRGQSSHYAAPDVEFWYLRSAQPSGFSVPICDDDFSPAPDDRWCWVDPSRRGTLSAGEGLVIHAPEATDLWHLNFMAPRLLMEVVGDCAIETVCQGTGDGMPIGGLCLWVDEHNFLSLARGTLGQGEIMFGGSIQGRDRTIGRGRLVDDKLHLRIERAGGRVRGLCSVDGARWDLVGEVQWDLPGSVRFGPYVAGIVDRTRHPGAPPHGGALRFDRIQIWQTPAV